MTVTPEMVKELREKTGAGMMDCKNALNESKGDMDAALEYLRKKGISTAAKKSVRMAADGLIGSFVSEDAKLGVLVEVNCETDFVTKTEDFRKYVNDLVELVKTQNPKDLDALLATKYAGTIVKEAQTQLVAKIGENLGVRRFVRVEVNTPQKISQYVHAGSKIGVIVSFEDPNGKLDLQTSREIAMHVAAMHPQYVRRENVPSDVIAKEKEIVLAQMGDVKKPPEILEKIATGKLGKFFTEVCLDDQIYVRDPEGKATVSGWLKKIDSAIKVDSFVRMQVGEGVEKRS